MTDLRIFQGQFYRGNELVKPEFGNVEQIRLLREAAEKMEARKDGVLVDFTATEKINYIIEGDFECDCGNSISHRDTDNEDASDEDDAIEDVKEHMTSFSKTCRNCRTSWDFIKRDGDLYAVRTDQILE
jgi:hypothetical protein